MEGMGSTSKDTGRSIKKRRNRITKKQRIRGKTIRNLSTQPNNAGFFLS